MGPFEGSNAPHVDELRSIFAQRFRLFDGAIDQAVHTFGSIWTDEVEETLRRLAPSTESLNKLAESYVTFALDIMRRQRPFEKDRRYPEKSYAEAAAEVYLNQSYMLSEYLPGLLVSHFLWTHHYHQARFFDTAFVSQMEAAGATHFAEVGIGTGLYSRRLLQRLSQVRGTGFDVSPFSKAFADRHMQAFGLSDRHEVILQDVVTTPMPPCQWLVCVEVIEHLEDPLAFLRVLRRSLEPEGRGFITTALNAPHVDHIYLYTKTEEVVRQLEEAGFALEQAFEATAYAPRQRGVPVPSVAAFIVA